MCSLTNSTVRTQAQLAREWKISNHTLELLVTGNTSQAIKGATTLEQIDKVVVLLDPQDPEFKLATQKQRRLLLEVLKTEQDFCQRRKLIDRLPQKSKSRRTAIAKFGENVLQSMLNTAEWDEAKYNFSLLDGFCYYSNQTRTDCLERLLELSTTTKQFLFCLYRVNKEKQQIILARASQVAGTMEELDKVASLREIDPKIADKARAEATARLQEILADSEVSFSERLSEWYNYGSHDYRLLEPLLEETTDFQMAIELHHCLASSQCYKNCPDQKGYKLFTKRVFTKVIELAKTDSDWLSLTLVAAKSTTGHSLADLLRQWVKVIDDLSFLDMFFRNNREIPEFPFIRIRILARARELAAKKPS